MWRRAPRTLVPSRGSFPRLRGSPASGARSSRAAGACPDDWAPAPLPTLLHSSPFRLFSAEADKIEAVTKKRVEDVMPIATGLEREELVAELEGRKRFDMDAPVGPFGTKEAPAIIKSYYDKRIVGCSGGYGEDEHDVVWFWLEKGKPHECSVCSQYFELGVIGQGGPPDGHGDEDDR